MGGEGSVFVYMRRREDGGGEQGREFAYCLVRTYSTFIYISIGSHSLNYAVMQQFLEKEHCEENILFWRDAEDFKKEAKQNQNVSNNNIIIIFDLL